MAVLSTTNLSLNDIHVEVGGSSGTQVSLNDADVRAISPVNATYAPSGISQTSETSISMGLFRGAGVDPSTFVTLSGTSGSPVTYFDSTNGFGAFSTANFGIVLQSDGDLVRFSVQTSQPDTAEWFNGTVSGSYWVRVNVDAFTNSSYGTTSAAGLSTNTWYALTSDRSWYRSLQATGSIGIGTSTVTYKVEISTNSSGTNIIETGYYRCRGTVENGV